MQIAHLLVSFVCLCVVARRVAVCLVGTCRECGMLVARALARFRAEDTPRWANPDAQLRGAAARRVTLPVPLRLDVQEDGDDQAV